tara:strand:+ start:194 stop:739 length:546 start_codon:yes stop_codon:yes gene_type:complete
MHRGLRITSYFLQELEKIAQQEPDYDNTKSLVKEEEVDQVTEIKRVKDPKVTSPGQMFGVQFSKMRDGSAKMNPMILPVPGYTFNPKLQKFVPNMSEPGWMDGGEEMIARAKREGYVEAKKEEAIAKMKQQATDFINKQDPQTEMSSGQPTPAPAPQQAPPAPPQQQTKPQAQPQAQQQQR